MIRQSIQHEIKKTFITKNHHHHHRSFCTLIAATHLFQCKQQSSQQKRSNFSLQSTTTTTTSCFSRSSQLSLNVTFMLSTTNVRSFSAHDDYSDQYPTPQKVPITFLDWTGMRHEIEAVEGQTLLEAAREWDVPMFALCNGGDSSYIEYGDGPECGSCLCFVPKSYNHAFNKASINELGVLQNITAPTNEQSRLACEIIVNPEMAGCTILLAEPSMATMEAIIPNLGTYRLHDELIPEKEPEFEETQVVAAPSHRFVDPEHAERYFAYQDKVAKLTKGFSEEPRIPLITRAEPKSKSS